MNRKVFLLLAWFEAAAAITMALLAAAGGHFHLDLYSALFGAVLTISGMSFILWAILPPSSPEVRK